DRRFPALAGPLAWHENRQSAIGNRQLKICLIIDGMTTTGGNSGSSGKVRDVRMRGFQDRTELTDALALLDRRLRPLAAEWVDLHAATGRVLAAAVTAETSVPNFDRSAMDGYALRGQE